MPELPEVETIKRQLSETLVGKKIKGVFVYTHKMVQLGDLKISNIKKGSLGISNKFSKTLSGKVITGVERQAKFLIFSLRGKSKREKLFLIVHLRMSGQLIYLGKQLLKTPMLLSVAKTALKQTLPFKHTHVEFVFSNGDKLFYNDTRQFGHIRLVDQQGLTNVFSAAGLGPEPLDLSFSEFKKIILQHPGKRAKEFLLDQGVLAGIGNIYADESLFLARIHPLRKIGSLSESKQKNLHAAIKKILIRAIKFGGSSIENFLMTNGLAGRYSKEHLVYGKAGKPCANCSRPLVAKKIGSRTATFCEYCQK